MIIVGSDWLVDGASGIARKYGISEFVIGMTIVGIGTSMPELVASVISAIGGHGDMALGNVIGSNIANILLILGLCGTITPLSMGDVTMIDIYVTLAAATLVMISALVIGRDKMTRFEGVIFLLCYAAYIYYLVTK